MLTDILHWWIGILAAAVANFVIGGIWYSPAVFAKPWLRMSGVGKEIFDAGLPRALIADLVTSVLMALFLTAMLRASDVDDIGTGLAVTFMLWLGFVATVLFGSVTYEHRPFAYYAINAGYRLVAMLSMGAIIMFSTRWMLPPY